MGENFSSIVTTSSSTTDVSESNSTSPNPGEQVPKEEAPDQLIVGEEADQTKGGDAEVDVEEEDEEGECAFCFFMKEGVSGESFTEWKKFFEVLELEAAEKKIEEEQTAAPDQLKIGEEADQTEGGDADIDVEEEEEEGECAFCLFMEEGVCRESFTEYKKCVDEAKKNNENISVKCFEVTSKLRKCMEAHADYYEPMLKGKAAAEKFLEKWELEVAEKKIED